MKKEDLLIIGCGEIGNCLIDGWLVKKKNFFKKIKNINVIEKDQKTKAKLKKKYRNKILFLDVNKINKYNGTFRYVFLAFKPNDLNKNLHNYHKLFDKNTLFFSLLAGKRKIDVGHFLPYKKNIIRLMLNTPISVNSGTIIYSCKIEKNKNNFLPILNLLGNCYQIKNENFFDILTAIVGSGPAFFYYLAEAMLEKAISSGLKKEFANLVIKKTFVGTAKIIDKFDYDINFLRSKVTSKGGTTEAAIRYLEKVKFKKNISYSINEALKKAQYLSLKK